MILSKLMKFLCWHFTLRFTMIVKMGLFNVVHHFYNAVSLYISRGTNSRRGIWWLSLLYLLSYLFQHTGVLSVNKCPFLLEDVPYRLKFLIRCFLKKPLLLFVLINLKTLSSSGLFEFNFSWWEVAPQLHLFEFILELMSSARWPTV